MASLFSPQYIPSAMLFSVLCTSQTYLYPAECPCCRIALYSQWTWRYYTWSAMQIINIDCKSPSLISVAVYTSVFSIWKWVVYSYCFLPIMLKNAGRQSLEFSFDLRNMDVKLGALLFDLRKAMLVQVHIDKLLLNYRDVVHLRNVLCCIWWYWMLKNASPGWIIRGRS